MGVREMERRSYMVIVLLSLAIIMLVGCSDSDQPEEGVQLETIPVTTDRVRQDRIEASIETTGRTLAFREVMLPALMAGQVVRVNAQLGDIVSEGKLLAQMDDRLLQQQLRQAEASLRAIEASAQGVASTTPVNPSTNIEELQKEAARLTEEVQNMIANVDTGATTQLDLLATLARLNVIQNQLNAANGMTSGGGALGGALGGVFGAPSPEALQAQIDQARAGVELARLQLENTKLRAPFKGALSAVLATEGMTVAPGTPLFQLVQTDRVRVMLQLNSYQINEVLKGQTVYLTFEGIEGEYKALVNYVSPSIQAELNAYTAEIIVPNKNGAIKPGMTATARIEQGERRQVLTISRGSILRQDEGEFVYVIRNGVAEKVTIQTGSTSGDRVEVTEGLELDDEVVVNGKEKLATGTTVEVIGEADLR